MLGTAMRAIVLAILLVCSFAHADPFTPTSLVVFGASGESNLPVDNPVLYPDGYGLMSDPVRHEVAIPARSSARYQWPQLRIGRIRH